MTIILPEAISNHQIFIAALYMIGTAAESEETVFKKETKDKKANIDSPEVKDKIKNTFIISPEFLNLVYLCEKSNICEPVIDSAPSVIDAIKMVACEIKRYAGIYLQKKVHIIGVVLS